MKKINNWYLRALLYLNVKNNFFWYPTKIKPLHEGVYQVEHGPDEQTTFIGYSYWSSKNKWGWSEPHFTIDEVLKNKEPDKYTNPKIKFFKKKIFKWKEIE